jgi:hypothetical protein
VSTAPSVWSRPLYARVMTALSAASMRMRTTLPVTGSWVVTWHQGAARAGGDRGGCDEARLYPDTVYYDSDDSLISLVLFRR